jgi:hypothetical protein
VDAGTHSGPEASSPGPHPSAEPTKHAKKLQPTAAERNRHPAPIKPATPAASAASPPAADDAIWNDRR